MENNWEEILYCIIIRKMNLFFNSFNYEGFDNFFLRIYVEKFATLICDNISGTILYESFDRERNETEYEVSISHEKNSHLTTRPIKFEFRM